MLHQATQVNAYNSRTDNYARYKFRNTHKKSIFQDCTVEFSFFRRNDGVQRVRIIIITSQALIDLFHLSLIISSKVFQAVFVHAVYSSALFLHLAAVNSRYMSQSISFVSSQFPINWLFFSNQQKFFHSFCDQKGCTSCSSEKFNLD